MRTSLLTVKYKHSYQRIDNV